MSRLDPIMKNLIGNENPDDLTQDILEVLTEGSNIPEAGNYYVFVYQPKTPNIRYDAHPLVAVTDVFQWGFRGINFHWQSSRNYTWEELTGQLYVVNYDELDDLLAIPYAKFITK